MAVFFFVSDGLRAMPIIIHLQKKQGEGGVGVAVGVWWRWGSGFGVGGYRCFSFTSIEAGS